MKWRSTLAVGVLSVALFAPIAQCQQAQCSARLEKVFQDDLLDKLVGQWRLTGTMMGGELLQEYSAEWALNHQFIRLDCRETREPPLLKVRYEAVTYMGCSRASHRYVAYLLDVFGVGDTLGFGARTGDSLEFVYADPEAEFHTTMTWKPDSGSWDFILRQKDRSGNWSTFAEKTLRPSRQRK